MNLENNKDFNELGGMGENDVFDRLIFMDDVSGLADKSNEYLTVSRNIFHNVFQLLAKAFNIFPSAVQLGNMSKNQSSNYDRETLKYIPKRELSKNRLYFEIAHKRDYSCLTIYCGQSGPAKNTTLTDNNIQQICFFSHKKGTGCLTSLQIIF